MKKRIKSNLEYAEGKIYAKLDAMFMRGENSYKEGFLLDNGCRFDIRISSKTGSPIVSQKQFNSSEINISMNFGSGTGNFFIADNEANHNFLHLHFESGTQNIGERIPFPENETTNQIISNIFDKAKEIVPLHFPNFFKSGNTTEFVGVA